MIRPADGEYLSLWAFHIIASSGSAGEVHFRLAINFRASSMISFCKPALRAARAAVATVLLGAATVAMAQPFPSKPVRFILGSAAGTVPDVATRHIAEKLAVLLGQPVIVENRPSAGGIVALEAVRNSPADGYTLSFVHLGNMSVAPSLFEHLPYDPVKDFTNIGIFYRGVQVLVANPAVQAASLPELIAMGKAYPGKLRYSSPGNGTPTHIFMESINQAAGTGFQHIPYRGTAAHLAVVSGEVDLLLEGAEPMMPFILSGRVKPLAVGGDHRLAVLPKVPTFKEYGIEGVGSIWLGVVAPAGVPPAVVARLNHDLALAVKSPDIVASFEKAGRVITPGTPEEMAATIRDEIPRWREVVRRAQIKVD
jgi:tripartite-type tricarboxylate transporter receptor subunit TctC